MHRRPFYLLSGALKRLEIKILKYRKSRAILLFIIFFAVLLFFPLSIVKTGLINPRSVRDCWTSEWSQLSDWATVRGVNWYSVFGGHRLLGLIFKGNVHCTEKSLLALRFGVALKFSQNKRNMRQCPTGSILIFIEASSTYKEVPYTNCEAITVVYTSFPIYVEFVGFSWNDFVPISAEFRSIFVHIALEPSNTVKTWTEHEEYNLRPAASISLIAVGMFDQAMCGCLDRFLTTVLQGSVLPKEIIVVLSRPQWRDENSNYRNIILAKQQAFKHVFVSLRLFVRDFEYDKPSFLDYAASLATLDLVTVFDLDDIMHPQRIELVVKAFVLFPNTDDLVHGYVQGRVNDLRPSVAWYSSYDTSHIRLLYTNTAVSVAYAYFVSEVCQGDSEFRMLPSEPGCCDWLVNGVFAANGWLTARKYVFDSVKYASNTRLRVSGEDVVFISQAAFLHNFSINVLDYNLGWYNQHESRAHLCA